jgi:hypothetical protein
VPLRARYCVPVVPPCRPPRHCAVFASIIYWPAGYYADAARYFTFMLGLFLIDQLVANLFRLNAVLMPTIEFASSLATCSGYLSVTARLLR